jgi:hypothetical protein
MRQQAELISLRQFVAAAAAESDLSPQAEKRAGLKATGNSNKIWQPSRGPHFVAGERI